LWLPITWIWLSLIESSFGYDAVVGGVDPDPLDPPGPPDPGVVPPGAVEPPGVLDAVVVGGFVDEHADPSRRAAPTSATEVRQT
jgi:hypothetical protein